METQGTKSVKLDIEQFTNLHHCIEDWITETRQIFFEDLPSEQQCNFDSAQFERQKIEMLFKQFDHILLDDKDYFYVVKGSKVFPVSHCQGAWNQAVNSHIAV